MKQCIVIGSGLAGLASAVILAKNGYQVTVLEQAAQMGGCLQCFARGDALFDTGMHYVGSADPGQTMHTMLRYLELENRIPLSRLDSSGYDIIALNGERYPLANGQQAFVETLAQHFPDCREQLRKYHQLVSRVASSAVMHSLDPEQDRQGNAPYRLRSVNEVIDSVVTHPVLRQVLAGIQPLYAGERDRTPFATHALISDFFNQSAFRIVGGSAVVAQALADVLAAHGGRVLLRHKVEHIECDDTRAVAVTTDDGQRFVADLVVSTIHPANTVRFVDSHLIRPSYRRRLTEARNTTSVFTVYLKFRQDKVPYMNHNLYAYQGNTTWGCEQYDETSWPKYLLYMHFCHCEDPVFAQTGQIMTYMRFDEVARWADTAVGRRGADYEDFKRRKAERLIQALEAEVPELRGNIERYYTSTPLTYVDYTGTPQGAMYGIARDVNQPLGGSIASRTRIPNLLLAGQSITAHGMLGVLAGSFLACAEVLTLPAIIELLKHQVPPAP